MGESVAWEGTEGREGAADALMRYPIRSIMILRDSRGVGKTHGVRRSLFIDLLHLLVLYCSFVFPEALRLRLCSPS
jgi:hypothetical protein